MFSSTHKIIGMFPFFALHLIFMAHTVIMNSSLVFALVLRRHPDASKDFGFLVFASHAAANMTATTLTGTTDGGMVLPVALSAGHVDQTFAPKLQGVSLFWAKGTSTAKSSEANREERNKNSAFRLRKHHFPQDSRTDCWFCLASPTCEKHLIVAIKDSCYLTMPKGAISPYHCLIVPVGE